MRHLYAIDNRLEDLVNQGLINKRLLQTLGVWCVEQLSHLITDSRSLEAIQVLKAYLSGNATETELAKAEKQARSVFWEYANKGEVDEWYCYMIPVYAIQGSVAVVWMTDESLTDEKLTELLKEGTV